MAWRIADQVERGEIDNRIKNIVTGIVWLRGWAQPVRLQLAGNAGADMAGCLVRFTNPNPVWVEADQIARLAALQKGVCGDMVARRQQIVQAPELPNSSRRIPVIYLEWFSEGNGRVVIEATDFEVSISEPSWNLTGADIETQKARNAAAWGHFLQDLTEGVCESRSGFTAEREVDQAGETSPGTTQRDRINALKREAERLTGGNMVHGQLAPMPPEMEEMFWRNVVEFEKAPETTRRELLERDGLVFRPCAELDAAEVTTELWNVIRALARHRMFLHFSDHLSDREMYELLTEVVLFESCDVPPPNSGWNCHIDLSEYGSEVEHDDIYLRYYADEETRQRWAGNFGIELPPREKPKYERDFQLPHSELDDNAGSWSAL